VREVRRARGAEAKYTNQQKRQAEHIEEGYGERGVSEAEAGDGLKTRTLFRNFDGAELVPNLRFDRWFSEVQMKSEKRNGAANMLLAALLLLGMGSLLSACNTVAGAGQDVSAIGHTVTNGASQTQRATGVP
jgi:predicted small secreted protein